MRGAIANGQYLRSVRCQRGLTQEQLSALANVDVKSIRKAEQGKRLDVSTLARLAVVLELDFRSIIYQADNANAQQAVRRRVVERWIAAWDARDMDGILSVYHEQCVLQLPGAPEIPFAGKSVGKDAIRSIAELAWATARTIARGRVDHIIHVSEAGVILHSVQGVYPPTGDVARLSCVQIFTFAADLIIAHHVEYDTLALRRILDRSASDGGSR